MIEANGENEANLRNVAGRLGPEAKYSIMLLGPEGKEEVPFHLVGTGSSVLSELTSFKKSTIKLPMRTLDGFLAGHECPSPFLMKLDVQGFELEVLRGGRDALSRAELVILEAALLPYNEGAPLFSEVISFMADAGFAVYDFCGQFRRESDHALFQTDVAFVKKDSDLRKPQRFWLAEP